MVQKQQLKNKKGQEIKRKRGSLRDDKHERRDVDRKKKKKGGKKGKKEKKKKKKREK